MRDRIVSEFRKLTTTRSVYAMLGGLVAVVGHRRGGDRHGGGSTDLQAPLEQQAFRHVSLDDRAAVRPPARAADRHRRVPVGSIVPTLLATPGSSTGARREARRDGRRRRRARLSAAMGDHDHGRRAAPGRQGGRGHVVDGGAGGRRRPTRRWQPCCGPRSGVGLGLAVRHQVAAIAGTLVWTLLPRASCPAWCRASRSSSRARPASRSGGQPGRPVDAGSRVRCCSAGTRSLRS